MVLGHTRHVSLEDTHITLLPPGSAAQPLGWEPTFVSSSFLLPLLFLGSTCLSRGKARVSRQAEQLMQKSVQRRKSFGFHHGHCHCPCTCWRVPCQVPMGDKASASRGSLSRALSWPCGSLGQLFLGSSHCVHPLATTVLPLCCACLCGSPQWQSRPPEQPLNESQGLGS